MRRGWYEEGQIGGGAGMRRGWYVSRAGMSLLEANPVYICVCSAKAVCSVTEHCGT